MKTKYLDSQLSAYRLLDEKGELPDNGKEQLKELEAIKQALNLHIVSNRTSAKDIKKYRKQGRMSGAIKREGFYKIIAERFDESYSDYDFTLLYDC